MTAAQNGPEPQAEAISAAQEAAKSFCPASDPFAPDHQMIAAQMLGHPIPLLQQG